MIYRLGLNKEVLLASEAFTVLFPDKPNPFSSYLSANNELTSNASEIEKSLSDNYKCMDAEIRKRKKAQHLRACDNTANQALKAKFVVLDSRVTQAIGIMSYCADGFMFGLKLLTLEDALINGETLSADDIKWLKANLNTIHHLNPYAPSPEFMFLSAVGLPCIAAVAVHVATRILFTPETALALELAIALIATSIAFIMMLDIKKTGLPSALSALSFFPQSSTQIRNNAAIDQLDNILTPV